MSVNAATLAEIQRKAGLGIKLTDTSNAANNAAYATAVEVNRKADDNIPLTDTSNAANVAQYTARQQTNPATPTTPTLVNQAPKNVDTGAVATATPMGGGANMNPPSSNGVTSNWSTTPQAALQSAQEQAKARIDAILAGGKNAYNTGTTAAKNAYDYSNQITSDNRSLTAGQFNETHNPFAGQTAYAQAQVQRNNSIEDTAANADYNNKINSLAQTWSDLQSAAPEQQQAIQDQLYQQAAALGIQADQLNATIQNNQANQANQSATLNHTIAQDGITNDRNATNDAVNNTQTMAQLTGYMSDGKGGFIPTNAKQQQDLTNAWTESTNLGTVTKALSDLTGIPVGTQTQAAKYQAQQNAISQQNANTSSRDADTSAKNANTAATNSTNTNTNATQDNLMNIWKATGKAPDGITGVAKDTPYAGANGKTADSYKTDPNFSADVAHMKATPADAAKLDSNPQPFIDAYGYDGYLALRKAAGLD